MLTAVATFPAVEIHRPARNLEIITSAPMHETTMMGAKITRPNTA